MSTHIHRPDTGQATAEYAVGTVGAACIGCVLIACGESDWFLDLIQSILFKIQTAGLQLLPRQLIG